MAERHPLDAFFGMPRYEASDIKPVCVGCQKHPADIEEYVEMAAVEAPYCDGNPDIFVQKFEGTYNQFNGHFLCTDCYIEAGSPTAVGGWIAP